MEQTFLNLVRLSSLTVVPLVLLQNVTSKPKAIWLFSWVVFLAFYGFAFRSVTRRVSSVKGVGRVWIHCFARGCPVVPVPFTEGTVLLHGSALLLGHSPSTTSAGLLRAALPSVHLCVSFPVTTPS